MAHCNIKYLVSFLIINFFIINLWSQESNNHPRIYISQGQKEAFLSRIKQSEKTRVFIESLQHHVDPYVNRHQSDPEWIISRLQMYWKTKYARVYVKGMDYSHGEGWSPVPTVRFSGSRDWATDYLVPAIEEVLPYMDDERGLYLQNGVKEGKPWEWTPPSETGHIIERINDKILKLAEEAAFLYWLYQDEKYAIFSTDILMKYVQGMYYREPPATVDNHRNAKLMGLQTFEVIHERIIVPVTISYDFLYPYLLKTGKDLSMISAVLKKWVEQEIKFGVPDNNWNLMQARYITYLALALEDDNQYADGKGQQYYLDQMINQNSEKQKALVDVLKTFDPETGIWPETAGYSTGVSEDILEIVCLIDRVQNNKMLKSFPLLEKAILTTFQYLYPNGLTVAFGDAKHSTLRFNALELLIAQYRKYGETKKEALVTGQLKNFIDSGLYNREKLHSLFQLFMYEDQLLDISIAKGIEDMVTPIFYAPNVSWLVQRNGMDPQEGMMISKNASLGNHSHTNGINIELYAKGIVFAPDCAAGVSYWSKDHHEYYGRFPAHNTVVVDGQSDYRNMLSDNAFELLACYPPINQQAVQTGDFTFADVSFLEPSTNAKQRRLTGTVRVNETSGYFIDIFRSARLDGLDKKHEYLFHSQGKAIQLFNKQGEKLEMSVTDELASAKGDLPGYDYFKQKQSIKFDGDFRAKFNMPTPNNQLLSVNLWMQGFPDRQIFKVMAPPSRALNKRLTPEALYRQDLPTLVVRQKGEARTHPYATIIDAFNEKEGATVQQVDHFKSENANPFFVGIIVHTEQDKVDYIFSDENEEEENTFVKHKFQGTYGIISYENNRMTSMFLGEGQLLESENWKIESTEKGNTVFLQKKGNSIQINATHKFSLTLPILDSTRNNQELKLKGSNSDQIFYGKKFSIDGQNFVNFKLPAMPNSKLIWQE